MRNIFQNPKIKENLSNLPHVLDFDATKLALKLKNHPQNVPFLVHFSLKYSTYWINIENILKNIYKARSRIRAKSNTFSLSGGSKLWARFHVARLTSQEYMRPSQDKTAKSPDSMFMHVACVEPPLQLHCSALMEKFQELHVLVTLPLTTLCPLIFHPGGRTESRTKWYSGKRISQSHPSSVLASSIVIESSTWAHFIHCHSIGSFHMFQQVPFWV